MSRIIAIIPARMGSSRFPGKPLFPILNAPMLQHVYHRTAAAKCVAEVIVATCDVEIKDAVEAFGGRVVMTSPAHERASDRVAEAAQGEDAEIVVMVQGDEPMIRPEMIDDAVSPMLSDAQIECVNLVAAINEESEFLDPNTIKVVLDSKSNALYFSREPIPTIRNIPFHPGRFFKQVCVIPFRRPALQLFARLPATPLEQQESIDMLRFLENGIPVRMVPTEFDTHAVDTPADLRVVEARLRSDPYTSTYMEFA